MKLDENVKGTVSFGNDNEGDVMGKCIISIQVKHGIKCSLFEGLSR